MNSQLAKIVHHRPFAKPKYDRFVAIAHGAALVKTQHAGGHAIRDPRIRSLGEQGPAARMFAS